MEAFSGELLLVSSKDEEGEETELGDIDEDDAGNDALLISAEVDLLLESPSTSVNKIEIEIKVEHHHHHIRKKLLGYSKKRGKSCDFFSCIHRFLFGAILYFVLLFL